MENFESKLNDVIQKKIISDLSKQELLKIEYADRYQIPSSFLNEVYKELDFNKIKIQLIENLENEMANTIASKMMEEYKNDIKSIMSNRELREDLRHYAKDKIKEITNNISD